MKKFLYFSKFFAAVLALLLCITNNTRAQVQTARYISMTSNSKGFYEYLPQGYGSGNETYPLIIFLHGLGELGTSTTSTLPKVLVNGLPKYISQGKFPTSFTVKGQTFKFIVLSPQFVAWPTASDVNNIINYAVKTYKVNSSRIYVTGLSMGGGTTWSYASDPALYNKRIAAIVPVCGALYPISAKFNVIADAKLPVWALHNDGDPQVSVTWTNGWISGIQGRNKNALVLKTIFQNNVHDAWTKAYDPTFKQNGLNIYEWMLQYATGAVTAPPANVAPAANAGADVQLTLPTNSVQLNGNKSQDPDGTIAKYQWTKISGPTSFTINNSAIINPVISKLTEGKYVLRLTITDNGGATSTDDITITVLPVPNKIPTVNAGADISIVLPANTANLAGSGTDPDGSIASYLWTKVSGPATGAISNTTTASTKLTGLSAGTYVYRLKVTDNKGAIATDDVSIKVSPAVNKVPVVNAGADMSITLPANSVTLSGSETDPDGTIVSSLWSKKSGPASGSIASPASQKTALNNLVQGVYVYQLQATDNKGAVATDLVSITVNASSSAPSNGNGGSPTTTSKYINVNLYGGVDPYNNQEWNNWNVVTASGNNASMKINSGLLKYSDNTTSGISALLSHSQSIRDNGAKYPGGSMAPAQVLRYMSYSSITRRLTLSGLSVNKKYTIDLYSSRNVTGYPTIFVVNGVSKTIDTYNNVSVKATFADLTPSSKGEIVVEIQKVNIFNYLNGFTVTETSQTSGVAAKINSTATDNTRLTDDPSIIKDDAATFELYPNPVVRQFQLRLNNTYRGNAVIHVIDALGAVKKEIRASKDQNLFQQSISTDGLSAGTYILKVTIGTWSQAKQFLKL